MGNKESRQKGLQRVKGMISFKNRYEARKDQNNFGVWDKKSKKIVWYSNNKLENESLCKKMNNGSGFQGNIPNFFNDFKHLQKGLTT